MFRYILLVLALIGMVAPVQAQPDQLLIEPAYLQRNSHDLPVGEPASTIFFTFDDGPSANVSLAIAGVLAEYDALGSFFAIGNKSTSSNGRVILSRLVAQGHLIANHTWEHGSSYPNESAFEGSLRRTSNALSDFYPASGLIFFRSPFGNWNGTRTRWTNMSQSGGRDVEFANFVGPIRWNAGGSNVYANSTLVNAADWRCWARDISVERCAQGYLRKIRANYANGEPSIVLMHDLSQRTVRLLRRVLEELERDAVNYNYKRLDQARWPMGWVQS